MLVKKQLLVSFQYGWDSRITGCVPPTDPLARQSIVLNQLRLFSLKPFHQRSPAHLIGLPCQMQNLLWRLPISAPRSLDRLARNGTTSLWHRHPEVSGHASIVGEKKLTLTNTHMEFLNHPFLMLYTFERLDGKKSQPWKADKYPIQHSRTSKVRQLHQTLQLSTLWGFFLGRLLPRSEADTVTKRGSDLDLISVYHIGSQLFNIIISMARDYVQAPKNSAFMRCPSPKPRVESRESSITVTFLQFNGQNIRIIFRLRVKRKVHNPNFANKHVSHSPSSSSFSPCKYHKKRGAPGFKTLSATSTVPWVVKASWRRISTSFRKREPRWSKKIMSKWPERRGKTSSKPSKAGKAVVKSLDWMSCHPRELVF